MHISLDSFDTENNLWETLPNMPAALYNCVGIGINGKVFLAGTKMYYSNLHLYEYDPGTKRWSSGIEIQDHLANVTIAKQNIDTLNVILGSKNVYSFDTRESPFVHSEVN